jgi:hypothetical protein
MRRVADLDHDAVARRDLRGLKRVHRWTDEREFCGTALPAARHG